MTQRTRSSVRPWSRRPDDPAVVDELRIIAERRSPLGADARPGAVRPVVRDLAASDRGPVEDFATRCSDETLRRRFHSPVAHLRADRVSALLLGDACGTRAAVAGVVAEVDGVVVGVGTLHRNVVGDGELAVMVEDAWHGTGVGSRLTSALFRFAGRRGIHHIVADVLAEPRFLVESLQRHHLDASIAFDGPVATIRMPVVAA